MNKVVLDLISRLDPDSADASYAKVGWLCVCVCVCVCVWVCVCVHWRVRPNHNHTHNPHQVKVMPIQGRLFELASSPDTRDKYREDLYSPETKDIFVHISSNKHTPRLFNIFACVHTL